MHCTTQETSVRLRGGSLLRIRTARSEDSARVNAFLEGLSSEARRLRYHSPVPIIRWWMVEAVTGADHDQREALLAFVDDRVVGVAEWGREPASGDQAHVAIVVDDRVRRQGIAQHLMRHLSVIAREHGIRDFVATVMTINRPVFGLIERMAPVRSSSFDGDAVEVVIPLYQPAIA